MKRISSLLVSIMLLCMITPAAYAMPNDQQKVETGYAQYGNYEIKVYTIIHDPVARSNSKNADRIYTVKQSGKIIAEITLSATFGYDGKTAWVSSASGSHVTYDNWSYGNEKITKSGGTASLSAKLKHTRYEDVPINISMTCSPTGDIS